VDAAARLLQPPLECLKRLPYKIVMREIGVDVYELSR
jgi:hypothetical protein